MDLKKLREPFPHEDLEWRLLHSWVDRNGTVQALCVPYVTNRAIAERLDQVCGPQGWKDEYKPWHTVNGQPSQLCGLSIYCKVGGSSEWVTKWDGAECSAQDPIKGGLSNAEKRAAVKWGIGAYLYALPTLYADMVESGGKYRGEVNVNVKGQKQKQRVQWNPPIGKLPSWASPAGDKRGAQKGAPKKGAKKQPPSETPGRVGEAGNDVFKKAWKAIVSGPADKLESYAQRISIIQQDGTITSQQAFALGLAIKIRRGENLDSVHKQMSREYPEGLLADDDLYATLFSEWSRAIKDKDGDKRTEPDPLQTGEDDT